MDTNVNITKLNNIQKKQLSKDSDYEDRRISYFIISYYFIKILNLATKTIFPIPKSLYPKVSILFGIILVIFFVMTISTVLKRSLISFLYSEFLWIIIFATSYLKGNAEGSLLLDNAFWTIVICVPLGIYAYSIKNKEVLYKLILKSSFLMTFILFLMFFFPAQESDYSMSFSYALLVPTVFHINEWFENKKNKYLLVSVFEIIGIVIYGSRGAIMSIACLFIIKFILSDKNLPKKIITILITLIILMGFFYNFDKIGANVLGYLAKKGYYSRTLTLLFSNRISYDSGRLDIFKYYFDLILQKPLIGWGVLGGWKGKGSGPHNMIIELLLAFGVIIGGIITLMLILLQFRVFFVKDKATRNLIAIYMSICIVLFFVSGNFLQNSNFFIFLGLVFGTFKNNGIMEKGR